MSDHPTPRPISTHLGTQMPERQSDCDIHGPYLSRCMIGRIWTRCPACVEQQLQQDAEQHAQAQRRVQMLEWQRRLGRAGIPPRFQDRSFDNYMADTAPQRSALAFAREFALDFSGSDNQGRCALFVGRPGTGKTHLAAAIGMHLLREGRPVLFSTVMRAIRMIKDAWVQGTQVSESEAVARLTQPDLLILDEVGVQSGSDFERNLLSDVLNERYENHRSCLLLSNLPVEEIGAYIGDRALDRLREDSSESVVFDWESYRRILRDRKSPGASSL